MDIGPISGKIDLVHISDLDLRIKDLWLADTWNFNNLVMVLPDFVKHLIMTVHIPSTPCPTNMVIWGMNDTCFYTSKPTFLWLLNRSKTLLVNSIWPWVSKLKALEKKKCMMLWQIVYDSFSTNMLRYIRNIANSSICGCYNHEEETTLHCLRAF